MIPASAPVASIISSDRFARDSVGEASASARTASRHSAVRMIASPCPVADAAPNACAKVPAPISAESPTRPKSLPGTPPVEVAAAIAPCTSTATAPTVPWPIAARAAASVEHPGLLFSRAPSFARALGDHFLGTHEPDADLAREIFRAGSRHQDVRRMFHHGAREHDRISHAADHRNRAGRDAVVGVVGMSSNQSVCRDVRSLKTGSANITDASISTLPSELSSEP